MDKDLLEALVEMTKESLRNWPNVGESAEVGVDPAAGKDRDKEELIRELEEETGQFAEKYGDTLAKKLMTVGLAQGYDPAKGRDRTVVSVNLNGVVVGPDDKLVLTVPGWNNRTHTVGECELTSEVVAEHMERLGIGRNRWVILAGFDAAVVKPPAHPPGQVFVSEQLGSAGPWCNTTQRAVERAGAVEDKVNDPLPVPPGYHVKAERIDNTGRLLVSYEEDTLEQLAAQSVGKPFKDQKGNVLGTVVRAWVEDGKVLQSIARGKVPDGACVEVNGSVGGPGNTTVVTKEEWNNLLSWCDPAAKAQTDRIEGLVLNEPPVPVVETGFHFTRRKTPDNVERLTLDQPTDLKVQAYDSDTGAITVGRDPPEPSPSRPCGYCNGKGYLSNIRGGGGLPMSDLKCPVCGGSGNR